MALTKQFITDFPVIEVRENRLLPDKLIAPVRTRHCSWYQPKGTVL